MSMDIRALAYLVAETTDVAAWKTYAEQVSRANADTISNPQAIRVNEPGRTAWLKLETEF